MLERIFHSAILSAIRAESTVFRRNTCCFIDTREIEILRVAGALKGQKTLNMAEPPYIASDNGPNKKGGNEGGTIGGYSF